MKNIIPFKFHVIKNLYLERALQKRISLKFQLTFYTLLKQKIFMNSDKYKTSQI